MERTLKQLDIPISAEMDNACNNIEVLKQKVSRSVPLPMGCVLCYANNHITLMMCSGQDVR